MTASRGRTLTDEAATYWLSKDGWDAEESNWLLHGLDPRHQVRITTIGGRRTVLPPLAPDDDLAALITRAYESGALKPFASPSAVFAWAMSKGIRTPVQFATRAMSQQERRKALDAAGLHHVSAAPEPLEPIRSSGYITRRKVLQPIDWPSWSKLREVKVFEALALLDNQAPSAGPPDPEDTSPEYRIRLRLLLDAMTDRRQFMPGSLNMGDPQLHGVQLVQVGAWAISNAIALPDGFPRPPLRREPPPPIKTVSDRYVPPDGARPANWEKWIHIPTCELWRAVCLTFDVEPDAETLGMRHWLQNRRGTPRGLPAAFPDRLEIAQANVSTNGPIHPRGLYAGVLRNPNAEVALAEVAAAGIKWGWTMPEGMSELAALQAPKDTAAAPDGPTDGGNPAPMTAKRWTPEMLAKLKAYRECHTMPETAKEFGITEQRIRQLLPSRTTKSTPFSGLIHRSK